MKEIQFKNIHKRYVNNFWEKSSFAIQDVSFELREGELVGFLGANGAGKTSCLKILMGFISQDQGEICFNGFGKNNRGSFLKEAGYLPEKTYLYQHLSGREFIEYIGTLFNLSRNETRTKMKYWSERLLIDHALDSQIRTYSKGMQQRLSFISTLINDPAILILDEPLSGLDPVGRKDFKTIFRELNKNHGTAIFFSSHVVSDVEEICNKVLFIEKGKMIYKGAIDTLIHANSKNEFRIKYFENDTLRIITVPDSQKNSKIMELITNGKEIVEIEKDRPSLESIIYRINTNE